MKGTLIILIMTIALLCYSSMVMADGLAIYGDYSVMGMTDPSQDVNCFHVGGEYALGNAAFGLSYASALSFDPDLGFDDETMTMIGLYAQYTVLDDEEFTFAAVLGYYSWTFETSAGIEYMDLSATSLAIGAKVIDKAKPVGGSLLYLWGVANAITGETYDTVYGYETIDVSEAAFSLLEVKFTYAFSDAICAYLAYQKVNIFNEPADEDLGYSGFGVGLQVAF